MNPLWQQKQLNEFCKANRIHLTAYSPLASAGKSWGNNSVIDCDVLKDIAKSRGKTTAQVHPFIPNLHIYSTPQQHEYQSLYNVIS